MYFWLPSQVLTSSFVSCSVLWQSSDHRQRDSHTSSPSDSTARTGQRDEETREREGITHSELVVELLDFILDTALLLLVASRILVVQLLNQFLILKDLSCEFSSFEEFDHMILCTELLLLELQQIRLSLQENWLSWKREEETHFIL
jgi:hypothetical protein